MPSNPGYADAISSIESGGQYGILGPVTKSGDRAYGAFQVMGSNVGPWTEQYYGKRLTPEEFLANPQAQQAVFQGKFVGEYVPKYGPEGAAQAWFAGPGGVGKLDRKDMLGTSVGSYGQRFMASLGSGGVQNNAPAPISGPTQPAQAPIPAQPAQITAAQDVPSGGFQAPAGGYQAPTGQQQQFAQPPPLAAPQHAALRNYIAQLAFNKIPVPQGFRGFSLRG